MILRTQGGRHSLRRKRPCLHHGPSRRYPLPSANHPDEDAVMDKDQVAAALTEIGTLLEIQGESSFRCNAYHNGALAISQYEGDLDELVRSGQLGTLRGIGDT